MLTLRGQRNFWCHREKHDWVIDSIMLTGRATSLCNSCPYISKVPSIQSFYIFLFPVARNQPLGTFVCEVIGKTVKPWVSTKGSKPLILRGVSNFPTDKQVPFSVTSCLQRRVWSVTFGRAQPLHSCPVVCNPTECSQSGSSVHGILQARILEWVAMISSRGSSCNLIWS